LSKSFISINKELLINIPIIKYSIILLFLLLLKQAEGPGAGEILLLYILGGINMFSYGFDFSLELKDGLKFAIEDVSKPLQVLLNA